MKHLMIDLETLGLQIEHATIQIGALSFMVDQSQADCYRELSNVTINIDTTSLLLSGYDIDPKTVKEFWRKQSSEVKATLFDPRPVPFFHAMMKFAEFVQQNGPFDRVWSHGASFDIPRLNEMLARASLARLWDYRSERCTRTAFSLAEGQCFKRLPKPTMAHSALHDARWQARDLARALVFLGGDDK